MEGPMKPALLLLMLAADGTRFPVDIGSQALEARSTVMLDGTTLGWFREPTGIMIARRRDGGWWSVTCATGSIQARPANTGDGGPTLLEVRCP